MNHRPNGIKGIDQARLRAEEQRSRFAGAFDALRHRLEQDSAFIERRVDQGRRAKAHANEFVHEHPWLCAALSLGVGVALGTMRRRRVRRKAQENALAIRGPQSLIQSLVGIAVATVARSAAEAVLERLRSQNEPQALQAGPSDDSNEPD